jgi:hypothetical protein
MKWNVIWQVNPDDVTSCIERDWFYEIFSLVPTRSIHVDFNLRPLLKLVLPHSVVCVSCPNQTSKSDLINYLRQIPRPRVLYHMSDEYLEVGNDLYEHCDLTIRNGSAKLDMLETPKLIQIPLGYVSGLYNGSQTYLKSSLRKCNFAFMGTIKHERKSEMLPAIMEIAGPHFIRTTNSYAASRKYFGNITIAVYKNSVFVPQPKGNWNPESNRLYDALEWGCIPLLKRYSDSDYHWNYHDKLFGRHPIPSFETWAGAVEFAKNLLSNKAALDALQETIFTWWKRYKAELRAEVNDRLAALMV